MSKENTIDFQGRVKTFNTPKARFRPSENRISAIPRYAASWKQLCYEILLEIMAHRAAERDDKTFGWMAMRDLIMHEYDDHSARTKIDGRSRLLTAGDLHGWERNQSIGDAKFRYIDDYIFSTAPNRDLLQGIRNVRQRAERQSMSVFSRIYQRRRVKPEVVERVSSIGTYLHSSEIRDSWLRYIVFRLDFMQENIAKVTCAYCAFDITKQNRGNLDNILFYEAYLIPMPEHGGNIRTGPFGPAPDGVQCVLKLFRPEYQGHPANGYAETRLSLKVSKLPASGADIRSITVREPNTLLAPFGFPICGDRRYAPKPDMELEELRLRESPELSDFLAEIFRTGYKGYLF